MTYNSAEELFDAFNGVKVLIIGDVMIDSYIWGDVQRISPEAPVPVVRTHKTEDRLGGAANVALNVQAMGAVPVLCSIIGDDEDGLKFTERLKYRGITSEGIIKGTDRKTPVKTRILSGSQHILRVDSETDEPMNAIEEKSLIQHVKNMVDNCKVIIFQDYDKGTITPKLIEETIAFAKSKGIPTVVDPKKRNFLAYNGSTLFKPNLKELREGLNIDFDVDDPRDLQKAAEAVRDKLGVEKVMITLSEKGIYIHTGEESHLIPAHIRSVSDVSGAGDTVISIVALGEALGLSSKLSASLANLGGGLVCEYLGVVPVDRSQLLEEVTKDNLL